MYVGHEHLSLVERSEDEQVPLAAGVLGYGLAYHQIPERFEVVGQATLGTVNSFQGPENY